MAKKNTNDDIREESKQSGTVTTDEGKMVDVSKVKGPAIPDGAPAVDAESPADKARLLNWDEQRELIGELQPGDEGYLPLDEDGNIIGPAKKGVPPEGVLAAKVVAAFDTRPDLLQTPAGAPISARMNPTFDQPKEATEKMEERQEEAKDSK